MMEHSAAAAELIIKTERSLKEEPIDSLDDSRNDDGYGDVPLMMNCVPPEQSYARYCQIPQVPLHHSVFAPEELARASSVKPKKHKVYPCNLCSKTFKYLRSSLVHMASHAKKPRQSVETKYQCNICYKFYTQSNSLKTHMRLHTGEKPYRCDYCDKRYADQANFRKHVKIHLKNHPDREVTVAKAVRKSVAMAAMTDGATNTSDDEHRPYKCGVCDEKFYYEADVPIHMKNAHGIQN